MTKLSDATRNKLKTISTATVATALYKRGFRVQCIQDVHPLSPDQPTLVGEAFTLRYMPAREDLNRIDVFRDRSHPQRKAIEINVPIGCGDAPVFPGDVILGDSDGVIVIPAHLADEIADETFEMTAFEDFVSEEVHKGRGIFGLYPTTDEQTLKDFAAWRKKMGR